VIPEGSEESERPHDNEPSTSGGGSSAPRREGHEVAGTSGSVSLLNADDGLHEALILGRIALVASGVAVEAGVLVGCVLR
jgi:hypothetical protein